MRSGDFAEELAAKSQWTGQGSYTPICLLSSFMNLSNPTEAFEASLRPWVEELNEEMMCVRRREEEIITEGSARSSGESRVFEQRTSSPVVQSCKRVDTSQEGKPQTSVTCFLIEESSLSNTLRSQLRPYFTCFIMNILYLYSHCRSVHP